MGLRKKIYKAVAKYKCKNYITKFICVKTYKPTEIWLTKNGRTELISKQRYIQLIKMEGVFENVYLDEYKHYAHKYGYDKPEFVYGGCYEEQR